MLEHLNCDYADANELKSLELALQLQAEELAKIKVQSPSYNEPEDSLEDNPEDNQGCTEEELKVRLG